MKFWKIVGVFLISIGLLYFIFLRMVNDPEIEGPSGRVSLGEYAISLTPISLGVVAILLGEEEKNSAAKNA